MATVSLGLTLSILPLPEAIRPLPKLRDEPISTLAALVRPRNPKKNAPVEVDWEKEAEATKDEMVFDALDLTDEGLSPTQKPIEPKPLRFTVEQEAERRKWDAVIRKVGAAKSQIIDPCFDAKCSRTALSPWFDAIQTLDTRTAGDNVRVIVIGTSLIASDHITDTTRRLLQLRHGSGGLGFMFVDRPTRNAGRTVRTGTATEGWTIEKVTDNPPFQEAGFAGVSFTASTPQSTRFSTQGAQKLELFLLNQPGGGEVEVLGDGELLARFDTGFARKELSFPDLQIPDGVRDVALRTKGGPVRLDGVTLEKNDPGVVLDSLGLPGLTAQVLLREKPELFDVQLKARAPALVVLMIGGNDAFDISLNRYDPKQGRAWAQQAIDRVKAAVPDAACLLASPPDAGTWRMDETITPRAQTALVSAYMKELAEKNGCALWDMQRAMGGEGAITKWWEAGLMNRDLVHPIALGGDVLGYLFETALEDARMDYRRKQVRKQGQKPPAVARPAAPPIRREATPDAGVELEVQREFIERPEALAPFFAKLRTLQLTGTGRVAVMQLGASHTAAQFFTDQARHRLAERFGGLGRGFIAAGKPLPRLETQGVFRQLSGPFRIADAMQQKTSGLPWGLAGTRAEGQPGSQMLMTFEEVPQTTESISRLQLFYFKKDGQPAPEVTIDGTVVPITDYAGADAGVRVLDFAAPGSQHFVSAKNVSTEPMAFYGLAHELMQPGVIYDSIGLFGATASVLAEYDQEALEQQIAARQPDLFVLFFGTNESRLNADRVDEMKASYPVIFRTLRAASPDSACLIMSPTDQITTSKGKKREAKSINEVIAAMRAIAEEYGCAFWATRDFMGGAGSIAKWRKESLANRDLVHLTPTGYRKLADAMMDDVLGAYDTWAEPPATPTPPLAPPTKGPSP
ncbi:MAG: GDSL-type esterase/lipase family protein [Archangium sp.]